MDWQTGSYDYADLPDAFVLVRRRHWDTEEYDMRLWKNAQLQLDAPVQPELVNEWIRIGWPPELGPEP